MRWHEVVPPALVEVAKADAEVQSVLGSPALFFMAGERDYAVPSARYTIVSPGVEGELYETTLVQIDFWVRSMAQAVTLSSAFRRLFHHDTPITVGGITLWSMYVDGRPIRGASDGIVEGSLDFRLQYLRGRYAA